ncbi:MAG TPA: ASCH domain-containing protein [Bdellovibrionales bacterium]|nr:ASCH domain-containing protein [Bdellovibrionales bacterium]
MKPLREHERAYWERYLASLAPGERQALAHVEASYAGNREITDSLLALYLSGRKFAGSSVLEDFRTAGDPLPAAGNHWILLNSRDEPGALLRTVRVEQHKFMDVPEAIAIAEGEGDLSLEYWRRVHRAFYEPHLPKWGLAQIEDATIVTEFFELVWR